MMNVILTLMLAGSMVYHHPMHVAFTNIEIGKDNTVSVSHKIILNDFNLLFFHLFEKDIKPDKDSEFKNEELALIDSYMKERFILVCDSDTLKLNYVRKDQDEEFLWLYYTGQLNADAGKLNINDLLMFDINYDQTNLVIFTDDEGGQKGLTFNWDNRQYVIALHE